MPDKRLYTVEFIAEGVCCGDVWLTEEEVRIARYVLGLDGNWENEYVEKYSPLVRLCDTIEEELRYAGIEAQAAH